MATHSSILAWEIPWTEEPGGLQPSVSKSRTNLSIKQQHILKNTKSVKHVHLSVRVCKYTLCKHRANRGAASLFRLLCGPRAHVRLSGGTPDPRAGPSSAAGPPCALDDQ